MVALIKDGSMQVLVTGASGFIGSQVARVLAQKGFKLRLLLRKTSSLENLEGLNFETAYGDLNDVDALRQAVRGVDYVVHLAGIITAKNFREFYRYNAEGTKNLAQACVDEQLSGSTHIKRFIYISSLAAAGPSGASNNQGILGPILRTEEETPAPVSHYGRSKLQGEIDLKALAEFPVTVIRPPVVYGPRDKAIFDFVKLLKAGIRPVFRGENSAREKYISVIYVDDLVNGIVQSVIVASGRKSFEVFFLADDGMNTMNEMLREMQSALQARAIPLPLNKKAIFVLAYAQETICRVLNKAPNLGRDKYHEFAEDFWLCSNQNAKKILGFQPSVPLKDGIKRTIDWYKASGWI